MCNRKGSNIPGAVSVTGEDTSQLTKACSDSVYVRKVHKLYVTVLIILAIFTSATLSSVSHSSCIRAGINDRHTLATTTRLDDTLQYRNTTL